MHVGKSANGKILQRRELDQRIRRSSASNAWMGIVVSIGILRKGVGHPVGNGCNTLFWSHRWIRRQTLLWNLLPKQNKLNRAEISKLEIGLLSLQTCLLYTSPSPRDGLLSRMPSSA